MVKNGRSDSNGSEKVSFTPQGDARSRSLAVTFDEGPAQVTVHASLAVDESRARWRIDVKAGYSKARLWSVTFPQFPVAAFDAEPGGNEMVVPYRRGQTRGFGRGGPRGDAELPYPGPSAKYQFLAAYGHTAGRGFYFAAEDGEGFTKTFAVRNRPETDAVVFAVQHFPANRGEIADRFEMNYDVVAEPFTGDWWDAARLYRGWWVKQVWASRGLLAERHDLPDWLVRAPIVVRPSTTKPARTVANNLTSLQALGAAFGGRPFFGV